MYMEIEEFSRVRLGLKGCMLKWIKYCAQWVFGVPSVAAILHGHVPRCFNEALVYIDRTQIV